MCASRQSFLVLVMVGVLVAAAMVATADPASAATSGVTVAGGNGEGPGADQIFPMGVAVDAGGKGDSSTMSPR